MDNNYTHISMVLDKSGSMSSIRKDTIGGFNTFLNSQKAEPGKATLSLVQFDDRYEQIYEMKLLSLVPDLTENMYVPRGNTALLDAMGRCIIDTGAKLSAMSEDQRPAKVIFVIVTDGEENASHEFKKDKINEMISEQRHIYKWEFVFLGANQDAIQAGIDYGIGKLNSMTFFANSVGAPGAYASFTSNVSAYRRGTTKDMAFTDKDRLKQEEAKDII